MVFGEKISKMGSVVNIMLLTILFVFVLVVPPTSCRHLHHNTTAEEEEEATKKDIITPLVTFAGSVASTYLQKWMMKDEAALATINNLSGKNFISEGCQTENAEVMEPPSDLKRKTGNTQVEAYREGSVKNGFLKLLGKIKEGLLQDPNTNLWIKCSFKTPIRIDDPPKPNDALKPATSRDTAKVIFLMSLRTGGDSINSPSRFAVAICTGKGGQKDDKKIPRTEDKAKCSNFDGFAAMKKLVLDDEIYTKTKTSSYLNSASSEKYEKFDNKIQKPIYLCSQSNGGDGVNLCVSAMMGNGGKALAQIYIHDMSPDFEPTGFKEDI